MNDNCCSPAVPLLSATMSRQELKEVARHILEVGWVDTPYGRAVPKSLSVVKDKVVITAVFFPIPGPANWCQLQSPGATIVATVSVKEWDR